MVIQGIPQSVQSKDLKDKVIDIVEKVNFKVTKNEIESCHWLGDSRKAIVRFVNRKHSFEALKNKKMLTSVDLTSFGLDKNTNLFLSQNLSDYNKKWHFTLKSSDEKGRSIRLWHMVAKFLSNSYIMVIRRK